MPFETVNNPVVPAFEVLLHDILIPSLSHAQAYLSTLRPGAASQINLAPKRNFTKNAPFIARLMPADAWDSHMHVTSPDYPLAATAAYKPSLHSLHHAMTFESAINVPNIVLVQPSIYGNDNSCLLDALREIGPRHGRGVVGIDPDTIDQATLQEWHQLGVRGVRLNLKSNNSKFTEASLREMLQSYAAVVKPLNWVLELFIGMEAVPMVERIVPDLDIKVCFAHFGVPSLPDKLSDVIDPYDLPGFQSLINMLRSGKTWVKFSAAYRFDKSEEMHGIQPIAVELLRKAGDRVVFASDWPHTRFDGLDIKPFVERCLLWTEKAGVTERVFSSNAKELWDSK